MSDFLWALFITFTLLLLPIVSTKDGEHHGQEEEPVEESEGDQQRDHPEEGGEDVRLREGDGRDGQERRDAAVQDRRADRGESLRRPLQGRTALGHEEGVGNVGAVVDAEADAYGGDTYVTSELRRGYP